ncbi:demethoxyubiquinone hydroxylase family protein [Roseomonas sp. BN140053]|uniref:demethoxyubiquinone hydroxylase family protein n=1 Tax=Roseomonas sp. BN140053 TaxID=3391898 RepID=UPI0039E75CC4
MSSTAPDPSAPDGTLRETVAHRLPGDPTPRELVERAIRVDHAGEYGAKRIYQGQIAVLRGTRWEPMLRHMQEQEQVHLDTFTRLIGERRVRPTALLPIWHAAGFALGAATALLGHRGAMACTVAVEEAIDEHYAEQHDALGTDEAPLKAHIAQFRAEEQEHRDIGLENEAELAPAYRLLSKVIKAGCKVAIRVSERV